MTEGARAVLKQARKDINGLWQPDGHDCDDDQVLEALDELLGEE